MAIFGTNGFNYSEPLDIENMTFIESTMDNHFEAGLKVMAESEDNFNNIMKAIAVHELNVLESTGSTMIYEAANLGGILKKFKEFFKNLWEKVKGIFKKFFAMIDSMAKGDKEFVKKYKKDLLKVNKKDFEYKGFTFTHLEDEKKFTVDGYGVKSIEDISGASGKDSLENYVKDFADEKFESTVDKYRGALLGEAKCEAEDFHKALFEYFRNGENEKATIEGVDVSKVLARIENSNDAKKKAEKAMADFKKEIEPLIKKYDKAENDAYKQAPGKSTQEGELASAKAAAFAKSSKLYQAFLGAAQVFTTAKLQAIKDEKRQDKSVCVKLLTYAPKNESAGFVHTEGGSFLDNVVIR